MLTLRIGSIRVYRSHALAVAAVRAGACVLARYLETGRLIGIERWSVWLGIERLSVRLVVG